MTPEELESRLKKASQKPEDELEKALETTKAQVETLTKQLSTMLECLKVNTDKLSDLESNQNKLVEYVTR